MRQVREILRLKYEQRLGHRAVGPARRSSSTFSGKRPAIVDARAGELVRVELFVGALGASSHVYAEAPFR